MYSEDGEDRHLNDNYFRNKVNGVYVELGALDGITFSNTKMFEDHLGWSGILIEPHPPGFELLKQNRPNNHLFNNLVSSSIEPIDFIYFPNKAAQLSSVTSTLPTFHNNLFQNPDFMNTTEHVVVKMIPKTFTEIIHSTGIKHIDLLSLDVEGHEYEVLTSWDFSVPIDVILIELLGQNQEREDMCRQILLDKGYKYIERFGRNEIYVLQEKIIQYVI